MTDHQFIKLLPNQLVVHNSSIDRMWRSGVFDERPDTEGLRTLVGAYQISFVIYRKQNTLGGYVGVLLTWLSEADTMRAILEHDLQIETDITEMKHL